MKIPHLVQYQGSKRNLAHKIIQFFPKKLDRFIEPFAGSAAMSIACAFYDYTNKFIINDLNPALSNLLKLVVSDPGYVVDKYEDLWSRQHKNPEDFYKKNREIFNKSHDPIVFLYLLARCVKGAVRYNTNGEFNQSPDNRRLGTSPEKMRKNVFSISKLLKNKCDFTCVDYREILKKAKKGDLIYMDPPYQGVCGNRDSRYYSGINFQEFINVLEDLNNREIDYIISYDGKCGNKKYGKEIPEYLGLGHILIDAGRSSQATLLGKNQRTIESLYISEKLFKEIKFNKESSTSIKHTTTNGIFHEERIF